MAFRKKNNSDTESGEEKEELYQSEEDRNYLKSLSKLEYERIMGERYEKKQHQLELEKLLTDGKRTEKYPKPEETLPTKREKKHDLDASKKKFKSEPLYNHRLETKITLEDIEKIRISRDQLSKWCPHLYFEKTVIGTFVKVNIGTSRGSNINVYLMCEIIDVLTCDTYYEVEGNHVKTNKMLVTNHGKNKKTMKLDVVSNSPFTEKEFQIYIERLEKMAGNKSLNIRSRPNSKTSRRH